MRPSQPFLAKGFIARSFDELRRRTSLALSLEGVTGSQRPRPLYDFSTPESVRSCVLMSDHLIGGSSQSHLDFVLPPSAAESPSSSSSQLLGYARFHGSISTELPSDRPDIERSGYAAFRTPHQRMTVFGKSVWDIDPYTYLAMRVKSDGRAYFINLQTESIEPTDLHQHRLFAKHPGQWETVLVKWNDFMRTNYGFVVEPQTELLRHSVRSVGIGLTDRIQGPFELCIASIWATNHPPEDGTLIDSSESALKNRKGEKIRW